MRAEDNGRLDDDYHARGGPLGVSDPVAPLPICEAWFEAAGALGIPFNPDFNGARQEGVGHYQLTQRNARRSSAATAYLGRSAGRRNLSVRTDARVLRVLVEAGRATGVEVAARGGIETLRADCEIIVSCGAIGSPALLLRSGIGPAGHLVRTGVPAVHDLPGVGSNLHDHLNLFTICECTGDHTYDAYAKVHRAAWAGLRYVLFRDGPAASSLFETGGFWRVEPGPGRPDVQLHLGLGSGIEAGVVKLERAGVTLNSAYLHPRSRGTVRLATPDPGDAPLIDPNYWAEPNDRAMAFRGLRLARKLMRQEPLKRFVTREALPGPEIDGDEALFDYACANSKTDHHPVGTCRMGTDDMAVVDPDLRVRGIEALRVADSSVMPQVPSCNTNAPTVMIGEKASDLILGREPPPPAVFESNERRFGAEKARAGAPGTTCKVRRAGSAMSIRNPIVASRTASAPEGKIGRDGQENRREMSGERVRWNGGQ